MTDLLISGDEFQNVKREELRNSSFLAADFRGKHAQPSKAENAIGSHSKVLAQEIGKATRVFPVPFSFRPIVHRVVADLQI